MENSQEKYFINEQSLKDVSQKYSLNDAQLIFLQTFSYEQRLNKEIVIFALELTQMLGNGKYKKSDICKFYDLIGERLPRINMYEVRELLKLVFCLTTNGYEILKDKFYANEDKITAFEISLSSCSRRLERRSRR